MSAGVFDTIVVGTDFSDCADRALAFAVELGRRVATRTVVLVHAHFVPLEIGILATTGVEKLFADLERTARGELESRASKFGGDGPELQIVARDGAPDDVIVETARERGADLIVVGTHGRHGLVHLMIGSVAERVLRRASCPTLTIGPELTTAE